ncbi:hypothetical protein K457DRAFT_143557, partial [Linnemannia elongata AG-77]
LLAAISVNRLFRTTLTPLLWSVFVESAVKSLGNAYECMGNEEYDIPVDIVQKNSSYIRFLDLSSCYRQLGRMRESPELYCSRLQELRLSSFVDSTWANRLILANPELRHGNDWEEKTWRLHQWGVTALHLLNACAPGHLVHASLRGLRLDNTFMEALTVSRPWSWTFVTITIGNPSATWAQSWSSAVNSNIWRWRCTFTENRVTVDNRCYFWINW